jgi:MoaA/NifB/PqqE/SkfB family radical SAM enzyme
MGPTGSANRILQLHPTLRCNLQCAHCYSSSGPREGGGIAAATLIEAVKDAAAEQYNVLSVSGGEPLLYDHLAQLLSAAHECGMRTAVATNGMLLTGARLAALRGRADILAISVDGVPASHNRIRGSARAFEGMASRLEGVRGSEIPFGFIFTLTRFNAHELEWVAQFAIEQGAAFLHVHPLEEVGRAAERMAGAEPDDLETAVAVLETYRLQSMHSAGLHMHVDTSDAELLRARPELVLAGSLREDFRTAPLGELVSPLVVEADGTVVPLQHGFTRTLALGSLLDHSLAELAEAWRATRYLDLVEVCQRTLAHQARSELPFFNWYRAVAREGEAVEVVGGQTAGA